MGRRRQRGDGGIESSFEESGERVYDGSGVQGPLLCVKQSSTLKHRAAQESIEDDSVDLSPLGLFLPHLSPSSSSSQISLLHVFLPLPSSSLSSLSLVLLYT